MRKTHNTTSFDQLYFTVFAKKHKEFEFLRGFCLHISCDFSVRESDLDLFLRNKYEYLSLLDENKSTCAYLPLTHA